MNAPHPSAYETIHEFTCRLGGEEVRYCTKPGLPDWRQVTPSAVLLAEQTPPITGRLLWLGCGHGAAPAALARREAGTTIWLHDHNWIALQMTARTLAANGVPVDRVAADNLFVPASTTPAAGSARCFIYAGISLPFEQQGTFDTVFIDLPKGRDLARRWLLEAWGALHTGGRLYLAGANDLGIKPALQDAQALFGQAAIMAYKKGCRLARLVKGQNPDPAPVWSSEAGVQPGTWRELNIELSGKRLPMHSLAGVFSAEGLDDGTRLLLDQIKSMAGEHVLDVGCGWGIIGLAAALRGAAWVDLLDNNLLAVAAARHNVALHQVQQARALPSDALSGAQQPSGAQQSSAVREPGAAALRRYSLILSNPPFHAGKGVDYHMAHAFIYQSWQALQSGGRLALVANRFIRYEQVIQEIFPRVSCLAENSRYRILEAIR